MINRGFSQTNQYFFNTDTGMLEKVDNNVNTIESLSKQIKKNISDLDDIAKNINFEESNDPITNITVITADDNLIHNYFTSIDIGWDASTCLSTAIIKMPKLSSQNTNYWATYIGQLTIYAGHDFVFDYVNNNSHITEQDAANSLARYWDKSDIKPFFRGEISQIKEYNKTIGIYVDNIGRRFQQKMPDSFRQMYVNNQNVRDTFQAICEFLGIKYICPPKVTIDNGLDVSQNTGTISDGTENDINTQESKINKIENQVKDKIQAQNKEEENQNINQGNINTNLTNNTEIKTPQNGYADINFDANGAIVHGSTVIETSPDMAETLIAMEENPLEKYLEDETGIVESVIKLLDGDMFEELHNNIMDYDAITVQPKSTTTSTMSTVSSTTSTNTTDSVESNKKTEVNQ